MRFIRQNYLSKMWTTLKTKHKNISKYEKENEKKRRKMRQTKRICFKRAKIKETNKKL